MVTKETVHWFVWAFSRLCVWLAKENIVYIFCFRLINDSHGPSHNPIKKIFRKGLLLRIPSSTWSAFLKKVAFSVSYLSPQFWFCVHFCGFFLCKKRIIIRRKLEWKKSKISLQRSSNCSAWNFFMTGMQKCGRHKQKKKGPVPFFFRTAKTTSTISWNIIGKLWKKVFTSEVIVNGFYIVWAQLNHTSVFIGNGLEKVYQLFCVCYL